MTRLVALATTAIACAIIAQPASAQERQRRSVTPYIEVGQVLTADLESGDVLTYSTVSAGIDANVQTRRVEVQLSYRYERRFDYNSGPLVTDDAHTGLARIHAVVAPGLTMEAGGIASRVRSDPRGGVPLTNIGNVGNSSQFYSGYVGPSLQTHVGPAFLNGAYRFGYTRVESPDIPSQIPGQPPLDVYDNSRVHVATLSTGVRSGTVLPVGITLSGSYTREDTGQLDQRFEGMFGRGDVVLPVGPGFALTAGAGYERIELSQRDPLLTPGPNAVPVVDGAGRQVTDPNSPRRIAYDIDGLFWDAGVIWRPSRRTFLEARVGERYGSLSVTGSLSYEIGPGSGIQIGVYDSVQSFGRQINGNLATMPTGFVGGGDPFGNQYSGCVFGTSGNAAGGCMTGALTSATTSNYRARGVTGVLVLGRGGTRFGVGGGYARRNFLAPDTGFGNGLAVNGTSDEAYYLQLFASRELGNNASISGTAFANYFDSDLPGVDGVFGWGANALYSHRFGRLSANAALGIFGTGEANGDNATSLQGLVGLQYGF